jgi:hypothetical protein
MDIRRALCMIRGYHRTAEAGGLWRNSGEPVAKQLVCVTCRKQRWASPYEDGSRAASEKIPVSVIEVALGMVFAALGAVIVVIVLDKL